MTGAIPQPQQLPLKSHLEKLRKYGAMDFLGKKEDDLATVKILLERTERVLWQLHCTPEQNLESAVSLLQDDAYQ